MIRKIIKYAKSAYLNHVVGYHAHNALGYWNFRWKHYLNMTSACGFRSKFLSDVSSIIAKEKCESVFEIGCGEAWLRSLPRYLGMDFSFEALKRSGLSSFLFGDLQQPIPLPDKTFDAVISVTVLIHIPEDKVEHVIIELSRIAKKAIVLYEPQGGDNYHCFDHDYEGLFKKHFDGKVYFLDKMEGARGE